jgi:Zn-finger nucleic acid-binding protein
MQEDARKCPVDGHAMVETERYGSIVDQCPECLGIWCDKGELEAMVLQAAPPLAQLRSKSGRTGPTVIRNPDMQKAATKHRPCPAEGAGLENRTRLGIAIDLCPICYGIWLDADELQAIINLAADHIIQNGGAEHPEQAVIPLEQEPERKGRPYQYIRDDSGLLKSRDDDDKHELLFPLPSGLRPRRYGNLSLIGDVLDLFF